MKICAAQILGIAREQHVRPDKGRRRHFPGAVVSGGEFLDAPCVHVEAHHALLLAERHGNRQPDVSESDYGNLATVGHQWVP
jgi:hypothetical protein